MNDLQTKVAMLWPYLLAAVLGAGLLADRLRGTTESGGSLITSWFNTRRRVQTTKRDVVISGLEDRLNGLDELVHTLQEQVNRLQELNNDLRYDLGDSVTYSWDAFYEIKRLEPDSLFPRPPKRRRETFSSRLPDAPATHPAAGGLLTGSGGSTHRASVPGAPGAHSSTAPSDPSDTTDTTVFTDMTVFTDTTDSTDTTDTAQH